MGLQLESTISSGLREHLSLCTLECDQGTVVKWLFDLEEVVGALPVAPKSELERSPEISLPFPCV